jgi:RNA polymerase sigma-70 factor (ECF subfamily)
VAEPDEQLVSRYLGGDPEAFAALVKRHEVRLYNVCLRILGDADDALDATQDTFLTALRKLDQFRGDAAFSTWMHRVAVNTCYDLLRKRRRQPMLRLAGEDDRDPMQDEGPSTPDPADAVVGGIDAARALARVPEDFRIVLVLADVQDLPYEEIARILDVPVGTVKSRVHRGRIALAREMGLNPPPAPAREPRPTSAASEEER